MLTQSEILSIPVSALSSSSKKVTSVSVPLISLQATDSKFQKTVRQLNQHLLMTFLGLLIKVSYSWMSSAMDLET